MWQTVTESVAFAVIVIAFVAQYYFLFKSEKKLSKKYKKPINIKKVIPNGKKLSDVFSGKIKMADFNKSVQKVLHFNWAHEKNYSICIIVMIVAILVMYIIPLCYVIEGICKKWI